MKSHKLSLKLTTILVIALLFSACKKQEVSISENVFDLSVSENSSLTELTTKDNSLKIAGNLIPENFGETVSITISSNADPEGFTFEASLSDVEEKDGKKIYMSKYFGATVTAGDTTNSAKNVIAVSNAGDQITVKVADGIFEDQISINCNKIVEYDFASYPSVTIYGTGYTGNEREAVHLGTDRVPNKRLVKLDFNKKEGFSNYSSYITFHDGDHHQFDGTYWIGIDYTEENGYSGNIYLKYYDIEQTIAYGEEGSFEVPANSAK